MYNPVSVFMLLYILHFPYRLLFTYALHFPRSVLELRESAEGATPPTRQRKMRAKRAFFLFYYKFNIFFLNILNRPTVRVNSGLEIHHSNSRLEIYDSKLTTRNSRLKIHDSKFTTRYLRLDFCDSIFMTRDVYTQYNTQLYIFLIIYLIKWRSVY